MIIDQIESNIKPGTVIPKPEANADFKVKDWGIRRGERALIYKIPNRTPGNPAKPYEKGITTSEFIAAYNRLIEKGEFTREWFRKQLSRCEKEGGCNFTTIGGIFVLLGIAQYAERGVYLRPT